MLEYYMLTTHMKCVFVLTVDLCVQQIHLACTYVYICIHTYACTYTCANLELQNRSVIKRGEGRQLD